MPKKGSKVQFQDHHRQMPAPLLFILILKPSQKKYLAANKVQKNHLQKNISSNTACSYGYKLACCYDDQYSKPVKIYRGEEPVNKFMHEMLNEVDYCNVTMRKHFRKPLVMRDDEEKVFKASTSCYICGERYKEKDIKVRDH